MIKTKICNGENELEHFLNAEINYGFYLPERVILGITQYRDMYTVIYKLIP